ncbi:hypothetical protein L2E82_01551 [Cichorium intybus]|uniref:Uncharacterized protein n=1 Tax=Cichorium intybus TaxID=13427 RepID=A0ACB9GZ51_CICIN|nr:hypothetical protein L2E82_01551 [Cichorium intybus]
MTSSMYSLQSVRFFLADFEFVLDLIDSNIVDVRIEVLAPIGVNLCSMVSQDMNVEIPMASVIILSRWRCRFLDWKNQINKGGYVKGHKDEEIWFPLLHVARRLNLEKVFAKVAGNRGLVVLMVYSVDRSHNKGRGNASLQMGQGL